MGLPVCHSFFHPIFIGNNGEYFYWITGTIINGIGAYSFRYSGLFVLEKEELNSKFLTDSSNNGFLALKGHRSVGGMRASIYNAMPEEGVDALIEFMKLFEKENL